MQSWQARGETETMTGTRKKKHTPYRYCSTRLYSLPLNTTIVTGRVSYVRRRYVTICPSLSLCRLCILLFLLFFFFFGAQPFGFFQWPYTLVTLRVRWEMDPCKRITGGKNGSVPEGQWKPKKKERKNKKNTIMADLVNAVML